MGSILAFPPRKRADATPATKSAPATIIIFPGVRYERQPDMASSQLHPAGWWSKFQPLPLQPT